MVSLTSLTIGILKTPVKGRDGKTEQPRDNLNTTWKFKKKIYHANIN